MPIQLETEDISKVGKTACIYGAGGSGKTRNVASSVPNGLWILCKKNNLGSHDQWLGTKEGKEATAKWGARMWDRAVLADPAVRPEGYDPIEELKGLCREALGDLKAGTLSASCIVIDEFTDYIKRKYGNGGSFTRMPAVENDCRWFTSFAERSGLPIILLGHEARPAYDTVEGKDGMSKRQGELREPGGPAIPFKAERINFNTMVDFNLRCMIEHNGESSSYYMLTKPPKDWLIKGRAEGWARKEPRMFGDLWRAAGYSFPTYSGVDKDGKLKVVAEDPILKIGA